MDNDDVLTRKYQAMLPLLNERQKRAYLATEADALGYGGVARVARLSGVARSTIHSAIEERDLLDDTGRIRRKGGGRKRRSELDPGLKQALTDLVDPETRGDPMSPLRWTCKSTRRLAEALTASGHPASHRVVREMLREMGYSLQANSKTMEGSSHSDRDAQFKYINKQVRSHQRAGQPVISVDCKKKELVGEFKNVGQEWLPQGKPRKVNVHDFPGPELGKAIPYGVYDVTRNEGWVSVGEDHDTATFAVQSIRRWWYSMGQQAYPTATKLLVTADSGGSNGYRLRLWKYELARLAAETGVKITVCHLPPGTSKWNKIEHRLFCQITMNWRGQPLVSHESVVRLISATKTKHGLEVRAEHDQQSYPTGQKVPDEIFATLPVNGHKFHGDWNYSITPSDEVK